MSHCLVQQPSTTYEEALARAADLWGIETEYWDIWGKHHTASAEALRTILRSLGVSSGTREEIDSAIEQRLWDEWSKPLPQTLVISQSAESPRAPLHLRAAARGGVAGIEIQWENGAKERHAIALSELPTLGEGRLRGQDFVRTELRLRRFAPLGYHAVTVHLEGLPPDTMRLIVTPDRVYVPGELASGRAAGISVALYGLRSRRNWGCGDFTDLEALIDWFAATTGGAFIALNPLHAIANRQPYNTSPYLPLCAFYRNLIYLDVERAEGFAQSRRARRMLASAACQTEIRALRESVHVEYERVAALKLRFLKVLFAEFLRNEFRRDTPRAGEFRAYVEREGHLLDRFAVFCALDEWIHKRFPDTWVWTDWPEEYRTPDSEATAGFAEKHWRSVLLYKFIQWQIEIQLRRAQRRALDRGMPIGLYHDLALATDRFGADLWAHRPFYVGGCRVGAPPDDFAPNGQDWSFPPPNAEHHRRDGYTLFADSIRRNIQHGGALRIDHVMRFFHLFWIPDSMRAAAGTYVRDYSEDLLRILALESVRNRAMIIGEDLGTVADQVRQTLARFGILSYRLLYFERKDDRFKEPDEYPVRALVSITTHDLPTLAGFWTHDDIEARRAAGMLTGDDAYRQQKRDRDRDRQKLLDLFHLLGLLPGWFPRSAEEVPELTGELHNAAVGFLVSTPSMLMALNQEDLFKDPEQQNLPGTTSEYPNWRHKMRYSIEDLTSVPLARACAAMFAGWLRASGRVSAPAGEAV